MSTRLSQRLTQITDDAIPPHAGLQSAVAVAATETERLSAARLVGRQYRAEGYLPDDDGDGEREPAFRTPHHLLPETVVFIARECARVVGTLTVVPDSPAGLPMEALYAEEVSALRNLGRIPCEICSLAFDSRTEHRNTAPVLQLFRLACGYLRRFTPVTDALVTLKPSHQDFYERFMGFGRIGERKQDPRFRGADTVAMRLTREAAEAREWSRSARGRSARCLDYVFAPPSKSELVGIGVACDSSAGFAGSL